MQSWIFYAALAVFALLEVPEILKKRRPTVTVVILPLAAGLSFFLSDGASLLAGIVLIISGADRLIAGAVGMARKAGVSPLLIGILIIGLGTSTPELFVNLLSALRGDSGLALGNILGSNIANIGLVIGLGGLIAGRMQIQRSLISTEVPILLGVTLLLILLVLDGFSFESGVTEAVLSRQDGFILLLGLLFYLIYSFHSLKQTPQPDSLDSQYDQAECRDCEATAATSLFKIGAGVLGLYFGGDFTVAGAVSLAAALGAGTMVLGIIVGVGTSLPELATAVSCALRKETDLIVGNVVGSNIFNILLILGITALVQPVHLPAGMGGHLAFLAGATVLFFLSLGTRRSLSRLEALMLTLTGLGYLTFSILHG